MPNRLLTRPLVESAVVAAVIVATALGAVPANAATPIATAATAPASSPADLGWVRVAHLSPDTNAVDVLVTGYGKPSAFFEVDKVSYGAVSPYQALAPGKYSITMVPTGAEGSSSPLASLAVTVAKGTSTTVAAYGRNSNLHIKAYQDDLATPAAGTARIRLLQASTVARKVSVVTTTGKTIATRAKTGTATAYVDVPAGPWTLKLGNGTLDYSTTVSLAQGSVSTLVVLDTAAGGLTAQSIVDSSAVGQPPVGAVQTGGGFLAGHGGHAITAPRRAFVAE